MAPGPAAGMLQLLRHSDAQARSDLMLALQRSIGNAKVQRLLAPTRSGPRVTIQRYQAGDEGHGGIEQRSLTGLFPPGEIGEIYFGNWLRDFSQLNDPTSPHPERAMLAVNVLALGEFGHEVNPADLGVYVASEHLDNPLGGGTVDDPNLTPAEREEKKKQLSPDQLRAYEDEEAHKADIAAAAARSGLPDYVERGKFHAKRTFEQAITAGPTSEGRRLMGSALHAIEDYFSHSNFVEAAIWTLKHEGVHTPAVEDLADRLTKQTTLGAVAANVDPKTGVPQIITGTYKKGANESVSLLETVKTEIEHGQFTRAFALGLMRKAGYDLDRVGRRLGAVPGGLIGALLGGVSGGLSGAYHGYEAGASHGSAILAGLGAVAGGLFGGLRGAARGRTEGQQVGGDIGAAAMGPLETAAQSGIYALCTALRALEIYIDAGPVVGALADAIIEARVKAATAQSSAEAPVDSSGKRTVTHSQLAKDSPEHALFGISVKLAEAADHAIGDAMEKAWAAASAGTAPGTSSAVSTSVTDLVDKYVATPEHDGWWRPIVSTGV